MADVDATGLGVLLPAFMILIVLASFVSTILGEVPSARNAARLARRIAAKARRRGDDALATLEAKRRALRPAALILAAFAVAAFLFAAWLTIDHLREYREHYLEASFAVDSVLLVTSGGLLGVAAAYYYWAPRLLERVRLLLESDAATTKEPPPIRPPEA